MTRTSGRQPPGLPDTGYGCAEFLRHADRPAAWMLLINGVPQSHVDLDDPCYLEFEYVRRLGHVIDTAAPAAQPLRVLHLGAGALTLARYVAATRPGSQQLAAEIDAALVDLVRLKLPLRRPKGAPQVHGEGADVRRGGRGRPRLVRIRVGDARAVLERQPVGSFDVVVADVFAAGRTPAHLTSAEFVAAARRALCGGRGSHGGQRGEAGQKGQRGEAGQKGQQGQADQKGQQGQADQKAQQGQADQKGQQGQADQKAQQGQADQKAQQGQADQKAQEGERGQKGQRGQEGERGQRGQRGGVFAANVADGAPLAHARAQVATVQAVFRHVCLIADATVLRGRRFGNLVLAASDSPLPVDTLTRLAAGDPVPGRVLEGDDLARFAAGAKPVTDVTARPSPAPPPGVFVR